MQKDLFSIIREQSIIEHEIFKEMLKEIDQVSNSVSARYNGQKMPAELQNALKDVNSDLCELMNMANGSEHPVQRADVISQIDPTVLDSSYKILLSYLKR